MVPFVSQSFVNRSFESPPPEQRIAHYREMAKNVMELAALARSPDVRAQFLQLAERWLLLALDVERTAANPNVQTVMPEAPGARALN